MITLKDYLQIEYGIPGLDEEKVCGVPIWRLARTQFRWKVRDSRPFTVSPDINLWNVAVNFWLSFFALVKLAIFGKRITVLFLPHPRLFFVNGQYLERLSDPIIDVSGIDNYLILERNQNGTHKRPRYHESHVVYLDFIDVTTRVLSYVFKPYVKKKYNSQIESLYGKLDNGFHLNDYKYKNLFANVITKYLISRWLIKPVLNRIMPKVIFFSPRGTYDYATTYCKEKGITIIELQHGIVLGDTDLYASSSYYREYDPDYFFVFGASNLGTQYGLPKERVLNLGFPYKNYITKLKKDTFGSNITLVASEPNITDKVLDILLEIVDKYPQYEFHFRCHPQERLTQKQYDKIADYQQIRVVDNHIESFCAISQYEVVIGELSSVLFEAMSLHKKIGRLNYGGLKSLNTELLHGGTIINSAEDFHRFMISPYSDENDSKDIYSDYQPETLNRILK